ncbi:MAG: signal recognition particle-docking protein FtsY [Microthrixaceae bacterium]|nr:signal recognition particle-docking protein FtsY [Microthrixaceae bacterium]
MNTVLFLILIAVLLIAVASVAFVGLTNRKPGDVGGSLIPDQTQEPTLPATAVDASETAQDAFGSAIDTEMERIGDTGPLLDDGVEAPADVSGLDATVVEPGLIEPEVVVDKPTFRDRLARARSAFSGALGSIRGRSTIDQDTWDDLEEALLRADVGIGPATELLESVRATVKANGLTTSDELIDAVKDEMKSRLRGPSIELAESAEGPTIWLFVGVNGVGKTTTIGKVGKRLTDEGRSVVMAAGDTFRAAAAEQLDTWAQRCGADIVRGAEGSDPSSVIFDGVAKAAAQGSEFVLADTAGRLHTKSNLMDELGKVRRVADKGAGSVTEVLLVLDATTGQNGLIQAQQFTDAVDLTGVVLTKLDGSAKGGIVFAIQSQLGIPVKLVGLGESAQDLVDFDADQFVDALFAED